MNEWLDILLSISTLTILEIVLGIDNLVFLSILTEKLPPTQRKQARRWGLMFAWLTRLILLGAAVWLVKFTQPIVTAMNISFSIRDLFLLGGGIFLVVKATQEIHNEMNETTSKSSSSVQAQQVTFKWVVMQVALMDIIFSLDSVLTAIGLTSHFLIMSIAITIAILVMLYGSEPVSNFIEKNPTIKILALSYLILIGTLLIADSFKFHVPRGYLYFAMGFSLGVEALNLLRKKRQKTK